MRLLAEVNSSTFLTHDLFNSIVLIIARSDKLTDIFLYIRKTELVIIAPLDIYIQSVVGQIQSFKGDALLAPKFENRG